MYTQGWMPEISVYILFFLTGTSHFSIQRTELLQGGRKSGNVEFVTSRKPTMTKSSQPSDYAAKTCCHPKFSFFSNYRAYNKTGLLKDV